MNTKYDVIIIGGGTAGVPAAIAAARGGAETLLIERCGYLGGTATYGIPFLGIIDGAGHIVNKGIMEEILERLILEGASFGHAKGAYWHTPKTPKKYGFSLTPFDPEYYKYIAQEMVLDAGAEVLFYSYLSGVNMGYNRVKSIEIVNKSGKQTLEANIFIDCSGDADLVNMAGGYFIEKDKFQNCSAIFRIGGVDLDMFLQDLKKGRNMEGWEEWHTRIIKSKKVEDSKLTLVHIAGHLTLKEDEPEITFTAVSLRDREIFLNATRSVGFDGTNAIDVSNAEISERRNAIKTFELIKNKIPSFKNSVLLNISPVGFRETRNILGDYILTKDDVINATDFYDGIARGAYPIDIHDPDGGRTSFQFIKNGSSYNIPYRCMLPNNIEGVLVAGRCISATHDANGSTRIMGCVVSQGEAVGTAAALAIKEGIMPRDLDVKKLRETLIKNNAIV